MKKLLIVDDDPTMCETLRLVGVDAGFDATVTLTDKEFREKFTELQPDIITLDLNLDQSDGVEVLRWLAMNESKVKIILISGFDLKILNSAVLLCQSQKLDVVAALHKPIDTAQLKSILKPIYDESRTISRDAINLAIQKNEFILYYQPIISLVTGKLLGVEALIRWKIAGKNIIEPDSFISIAEDTGLIIPISFWVNHEAIKTCAALKTNGWDIKMSINISAKLLSNLELPDDLFAMTQQYNIKPEQICIEITESAAVDNVTRSMDILTRLRIKGFNISIDDFGTGFSTLIELQRMPCNALKIDKSFISKLRRDTPEFIIVKSIINLGHEFGLSIVAEGVETPFVLDILKEIGCDSAQGFYFAYPLEQHELEIWLQLNVDKELNFRFPG